MSNTDKEKQANDFKQQQREQFLKNATPKSKGIGGHIGDAATSFFIKGGISIPELAVGAADIFTGGKVGKFLENEGGMLGFRPKEAKEFASKNLMTEKSQKQIEAFQEAEGFTGKVGNALKNPSLIANTVTESLPAMFSGGIIGRGLGIAAKGLSPVVAGALGEGIVGAGLQAESIRQQTEDGLLTPTQAGLAAATGATTAGFGYAGGKLASKLGIGDVDTILAGGGRTANPAADIAGSAAANAAKNKGILRRGAEGALTEGLLEELPQSVSETILQNQALGRPLDEGVSDAAALGLLSGAAMGAGAGMFAKNRAPQDRITPTEDMGQEDAGYGPTNPLNPNFNPAGLLGNQAAPQLGFQGRASNQFNAGPNGEVFTGDQYNEYLAGQQEQARQARDANQPQPRNFDDVTQAPQGYEQFGNDPRLPAPNGADFTASQDGEVYGRNDINTRLNQEREQAIERRARIARGEILDNTPIPEAPKPSELMGLDANKGSLSAAAVLAVDSGASDVGNQMRDVNAEQTMSAWQSGMTDRLANADQNSEVYGRLSQAIANEPKSISEKARLMREADEIPKLDADIKQIKPNTRVLDEARAQTVSYTPDSEEVQAQWDVVDASDLVTSNTDSFTINPDYPASRQPRDRKRGAYIAQVNEIVEKFKPALLGESAVASAGSPFVGATDNVVDSGNGRTIALRRIYKENGEKAQAYRQFVNEQAERFGLDTSQINFMQSPVLVRRNKSNENRDDFALAVNKPIAAEMSSTEMAASDARKLPDASLLAFNEEGNISLYQSHRYLKNFVGSLSKNEQTNMMDEDGGLSRAGKNRIEAAIIQDAYNSSKLVSAVSEKLDSNTANVLRAITDKAPQISQLRNDAKNGVVHSNTLGRDIADATQVYMNLRNTDKKIDDYLAQDSLLGDGLTDGAKDILKMLSDNKMSAKAISENIQQRINDITGKGNPKQTSMFDDELEDIAPNMLSNEPAPTQLTDDNPTVNIPAPGQTTRPKVESTEPQVRDVPIGEWVDGMNKAIDNNLANQKAESAGQTKYRLPTKDESNWNLSKPSTERESVLVDAVSKALDEGVIYNKDLNKRVAELLSVPQSVLDVNTTNTENGDFGYDVFNARRKVESNDRNDGNKKAKDSLKSRLSVGRDIGTIVIDNGKTLRRATVESMDETSVKIAGTSGSKRSVYSVPYTALESAIKRAEDEGKREVYKPYEQGSKPVSEKVAKADKAISAVYEKEQSPLDHGELSIPNRTKNIDRDLDKYKADKAKADARKLDEVKARNAEKEEAEKARIAPIAEQAMAEYKEIGTAMVKQYKDKLEAQGLNAREFFRDEAKYKPESFLKLAAVFRKENQEAGEQEVVAPKPVAKPAPKKAAEPVAEIEDFGEKITGARKDMESSYQKEITDDDIASQPLSKIWPKKDVDSIEDTQLAALAATLRGTIPSKPRSGYKLDRWVSKVKSTRGIMQNMLSSDMPAEKFIDQLTQVKEVADIGYQAQLLAQLDREYWLRIESVDPGIGYQSLGEDGAYVPFVGFLVKIDKRTHTIKTSKRDISEITDKVNELLSGKSSAKTNELKFTIYGRGRGDKKSYFIAQNSDKDKTPLIQFNDLSEARTYKNENNENLTELWSQHKDKVNVRKTDIRLKSNRDRIGPDHRGGLDVTTDQFMEAFGLRGGQFGNWVKQGANSKDRQNMLNDTYDAFMDLAGVLNIPPEAIGLGGKLAMSFGARGKGSFSAHYEPSQVIINLTKTKGAGSLAHEWFHALDNHFTSFRDNPKRNTSNQNAYITYLPEPMMVFKPRTNSERSFKMLKSEIEMRRIKNPSDIFDAENWMPDPNHPQGVRPQVEEVFADLVNALDESPMKGRANTIDAGKADGYWSRIIERAARAFEGYIIHKLDKQGARSDFLANVTPEDAFPRNMDRYPYLLESEMAPVAEAFDNLFATIDSKPSEDGNGKTLFSRAGQMKQAMDNVKAGAIGSTQTTRQQVIAKLSERFGKETVQSLLDNNLLDIKTLSDFVVDGKLTIPNDVDGLYFNGKATLIADNLSDDMIIPTFLHELGGHGGLQTMMSDKAYAALMKDFDAMVKAGDPLAMQAKAMADKVARNEQDALDEYLPYLITLASRQQAKQGKVAGMINRMVMAIRSWLKNTLGVPIQINAQDILSLAERMVNEIEKQGSLDNVANAAPQFSDPNIPDKQMQDVRDQYENTDQWMTAPNGKPTNLTENQWVQTRTPAFKEWFGDWEGDPDNASKVVDDNGEPMVVYHGSPKRFYNFDINNLGKRTNNLGHFGKGFYFTPDIDTANRYAGYRDSQGGTAYNDSSTTYRGYLNIKKPFYDTYENLKPYLDGVGVQKIKDGIDRDYLEQHILNYDPALQILIDDVNKSKRYPDGDSTYEQYKKNGGKLSDEYQSGVPLDYDGLAGILFGNIYLTMSEREIDSIQKMMGAIPDKYISVGFSGQPTLAEATSYGQKDNGITENIMSDGFDGVIHAPDGVGKMYIEYVAFNPNQIKSATDNIGTFDNTNPDIRFSDPNVPAKQLDDVRAKYEGTDEWMKSPNNSDTNLTEQQWLQVRTPAFKQWFGDWESNADNASKAIDSNGEPLILHHGTGKNFTEFSKDYFNSTEPRGDYVGQGFYFSPDKEKAGRYADTQNSTEPTVISAMLNIKNPIIISGDKSRSDLHDMFGGFKEFYTTMRSNPADVQEKLAEFGYDGLIDKDYDQYATFEPNQIKSATDNVGTFDPSNPDIRFSRAAGMNDQFDPRNIAKETATRLYDWASSAPPGKLSWWHKTIGTMYNLAQRNPYFKPVFENTEKFINDVSYYASKASELAPRLLPQLDSLRDINKAAIGAKDNEALSKPIFEGTLLWGRDLDGKAVLIEDWRKKVMAASKQDRLKMLKDAGRITPAQEAELAKLNAIQANRFINGIIDEEVSAGLVWKDSELRSKFNLDDKQIELYKEFRSATDKSLDSLTRSDMLRRLGKNATDIETQVMEAATLREAVYNIEQHINSLIQASPSKEKALKQTLKDIKESQFRTNKLKDDGYAPLSRFGQYTVDVVDAAGNREYFGMFESAYEARKMEAEMKGLYDDPATHTVSRGTLSNEEFKLFAGVTPETAELFGEMLGLDATGDKAADEAFQEYLKRTKNNRSAMKRLMHRKGIKGYSEDVGRVLASFIYSNARHTSAALNMGNIDRSIQDIPKGEGQLKDAAVKLAEYIKNPQEEAQLMRGWMFAQYLGGSIASAVVNITQPIAVSFPYLSQFGGATKAATQLGKASSDWTKAFTSKNRDHFEPDLLAAIERAEADGTLSPQEVHNLLKQAAGKNPLSAGDGTKIGDAKALAGNSLSRVSLAWGALFSGAEQINRRVTFVAAYRMAVEQGMDNPADFATKSIKETQFVYNKASRMNWARGSVGGTLMTFKTYTVSYIELMHRLWNQGEKGSQERAQGRKATMLMLGVMFMLSGSGGLPFMEDAEDLIDGIGQIMGYNLSSKKARQDFLDDWFGEMLGDFLESGASSLPGSPTDVSGRLGLGNLIPGTGIFRERTNNTRDVMELAGPAGDFAGRIASGTRSIAKGAVNLDGNELKKGALEFAPTAVRNAVKGISMGTSGIYKDTKGYKVTDVSPVDAAFKFAGFQPLKVSKIQEANYLGQTDTSYYTLRASNIRALWAAGVVEGNQAKIADARAAVTDWNSKNPRQKIVIKPTDIARRVREMKMDKSDRIAKKAPKSMRGDMQQSFSQVRDGFN